MCKTLGVLPRSGGVLDQPGNEMLCLHEILRAFSEYEKLEERRETARAKSRQKVVSE